VNIPLESLARRIHELPPRGKWFTVFDVDRRRALWARSRLRARGRSGVEAVYGESWLAAGPAETGPTRGRLWEPHGLLTEAVETAGGLWGSVQGRRALDIACGAGRDGVFLALSGFVVEGWDLLPDALERCNDLARRCGVELRTACRDVERLPESRADSAPDSDASRFDLICCFNYLHRPLMPWIARSVRPGGLVVYETFVYPQRALFGKPRREAFILKPGELRTYFPGWEVLVFREGLAGPRRHAASLIARRSPIGRQ